MKLIYENTDITNYVLIKSCIHRDVSGGRSDSLEIVMDHAEQWFRWGPKKDDRISALLNGYTTGTLYLNTIIPEDGFFRIIATSMPSAVYRKTWRSYENRSLADIMAACGAECEMGYGLYGLDGKAVYPFLMRKDEGCTAFLERLMQYEGAQLKCVNERFTGIGIEYAQGIAAKQKIEISANQPGVFYRRFEGKKWAGLKVVTPYAQALAEDTAAGGADIPVITNVPAMSAIQAGRWARGLLLNNNRTAEKLSVESTFNSGFSAMVRIDVESKTDASGAWLVGEVFHDLKEEKTTAHMLRCITSIR